MTVLSLVSDIDDSKMACQLEFLASGQSLLDMRQVYLVVQPYLPYVCKIPVLVIENGDCFESLRLLVALAVVNYALYVHGTFEVNTLEPGMTICFKADEPLAHIEMTDWCLIQAIILMNRK